jgi:hypothetical protein
MLVDHLDVAPDEFTSGTGWEIKAEGACKADICVPLGDAAFSAVDVAGRLGMAVVTEPELGLWAFGPESVSGRALVSATAPELDLPDLDGRRFRLSSLRGQKVILVAWAPY